MALLYSTSAPLLKEYLEAGGDPNIEDTSGFSSLHSVAWLCRPDLLELLLAYGAAADTRDIHGVTPLMVAAEKGCAPIIRLILEKGIAPGVTDLKGSTAFFRAVKGCHGEALKMIAEELYKEKLLMKEVGFSFGEEGEVAPFNSFCKNDPVIWAPVLNGVPDFRYCYLAVEKDERSESLRAEDSAGDSWYIFIAGEEFIARRKEQ